MNTSCDLDLTQALRAELIKHGAALVGIGDLSVFPELGWPVGVSVAVPVPAAIVRDLKTAPTLAYYEAYSTLNKRLNAIVTAGEEWLRARGYRAWAQTTDRVKTDENHCSPLPHKTVATRAGLGWIGKNCLLVTPQYGPAVRLSSLLTDAPLACEPPVTASRCGGCSLCVQACPGQALHGALWQAGMARAEIVDVEQCYRTQLRIMQASTGIETDLCGKCFAVCAYAQKYLQNAEK